MGLTARVPHSGKVATFVANFVAHYNKISSYYVLLDYRDLHSLQSRTLKIQIQLVAVLQCGSKAKGYLALATCNIPSARKQLPPRVLRIMTGPVAD
jgi:hypothetical protein